MPKGTQSVPPRTKVEETQGDVWLCCPSFTGPCPGRETGPSLGSPRLCLHTGLCSTPRDGPFPAEETGEQDSWDCPSSPRGFYLATFGEHLGSIPAFQKA